MKKKIFGLIGKNISYSFSRDFFLKKFKKESLQNNDYLIFDIPRIKNIELIFNNPNLLGCNITIPYKIEIISFLDKIDFQSKQIGSVNVVSINNNKRIGYNTDIIGFRKSFKKFINYSNKNIKLKSLILGTGGVSKTVSFVLNQLDIPFKYVSRKKKNNKYFLTYEEINKEILDEYNIIINCTPLGTFPKIYTCPSIPYQYISKNHFFYDLVYNPVKTLFLKNGEKKGASIKNGLEMLYIQAEKSWEIWNS
ncbi:shikimate dehydrogenase family protein [Blattabacterium cuenoti]|uniref:shikimate dehydrogenase family protein n=1 Tax=Blattabacterium cuenoti TaxID=1653831 RepID=UPI00374DFAF9